MSYLKSLQTEDATNSQRTPPSAYEGYSGRLSAMGVSGRRSRNSESRQGTRSTSNAQQTRSDHEDIFLAMATGDPNRAGIDTARNERRMARIALASKRNSFSQDIPLNEDNVAGDYLSRFDITTTSNSGERGRHRLPVFRPSKDQIDESARDQEGISTRPLRDRPMSSMGRSFSNSVADTSDLYSISAQSGRRPSFTDAQMRSSHYRSADASNLAQSPPESSTHADSDLIHSNSNFDRTFSEHADSVDSTPASIKAVWDEIDELKSSAKRLELGRSRKTPDSTRKNNDNADQPDNTSASQPYPRNSHPNLHLALARARTILDPNICKHLEQTAADALDLAAGTSSNGPQGTTYSAASIINGAAAPDRHLRRKADNLCRNVTDLCIALCEAKSSSSSPPQQSRYNGRPSSRDHTSAEPSPLVSLEERRARMAELDERASSRLSQSRSLYRSDSRLSNYESLSSKIPHSSRSFRRTSLAPSAYDEADLEEDEDPTLRAPSRALTEVGSRLTRRTPSRYNREYTSRYPLPESLTSSGKQRLTGRTSRYSLNSQTHDVDSSPHGLSRESLGDQHNARQRVASAGQLGRIASRSSQMRQDAQDPYALDGSSPIEPPSR